MTSNAQRWFTLAIAAAICIYAGAESNAPGTVSTAPANSASDAVSQEKPVAAPSDASDTHCDTEAEMCADSSEAHRALEPTSAFFRR